MIADWTVEVSPESPVLVVPWEQWTDLRSISLETSVDALVDALACIPETLLYPELVPLLRMANSPDTLTSKVDVFPVTREEVDPELAEAGPQATECGLGCYLDVLTPRLRVFPHFEHFEQAAAEAARSLRTVSAPLCCAEIVVRPAHLHDTDTFGWTLYAMGFGADAEQARTRWGLAAELTMAALLTSVAGRIQSSGAR